ncbi:putative disease resistance protein [Prunus yedoensis var. nudiflora]|uniref:Putative disease resistance protein n=1 Tax=Prunus yedoensis var. nudiflora TaxID=2094558 RepID=A0A314YBS5_PRUYE|nr:putative disease resistance protein [Prunus yedoensis var. nudiflora]
MTAGTIAIVASVCGCVTVVVNLISAPCIRETVTKRYHFFKKRRERLEILESKWNDLGRQLYEVERQSKGKVVLKSFKNSEWLETAEKLRNDANPSRFREQISDINHFYEAPKCFSQYNAGKEIEDFIGQLDAVHKEGTEFLRVDESVVVGWLRGSSRTKLLGEAENKIEEIKGYVTGKAFQTIRVHGMPGSGKTEIVSAVNDSVLKDYQACSIASSSSSTSPITGNNTKDHFDKVIWVTVEHNGTESSIDNLQNKIAEQLKIDLTTAGGSRAETLANKLKVLTFLIILDDMRKDFPLKSIGIPVPTKENGCKIIIVSRSLPVCPDIRIGKYVKIQPLPGREAQKLFEIEASIELSKLREDTQANAKQMIDEWECLPFTIIWLAQTLKELKNNDGYHVDDVVAWNATFDMLKESPDILDGMNEKAFNILKDNYDALKEETKKCFLYCALYPSGHLIETKELVEYWFWEGLIDGNERSGHIEDMGQAKKILYELLRAHLVEKVDSPQDQQRLPAVEGKHDMIKMRNLARKMAVHLTSPGQFLIKAGEKLPHAHLHLQPGKYLSGLERASLMTNKILAIMEQPKFSKLSTLLLQNNPIIHLHDNFFCNMPNLKVLDLSQTNISTLPQSASCLKNLTALLLRNCPYLKALPSLENSEELLLLDLSDTPITKLPYGMKKLTKLIRLNLSRTCVGEFRAEVVHALVSLEEVLMITNDDSAAGSLLNGASSIEKPGILSRLAILQAKFPDAEDFNRYAVSKTHHLYKLKVCVGDVSSTHETKFRKNSVLFIQSDFHVKGQPITLPGETYELHVMRNLDLHWLPSYSLDSLKVINISGCESLVYLFKRDTLYNLPNIETISVEKCPKMKALIESKGDSGKLLPFQLQPHLDHLKFIHISDLINA